MTDHPSVHNTQDGTPPVTDRCYDMDPATLSRVTVPAYDYADRFALVAADAEAIGTPEGWARAALRDAAGSKGQIIWRGLLGLRLARESAPGQIAGWEIADHGAGWVTLAARSWLITGNLVVEVDAGGVSLSTFVHYERRIGAIVWKWAAPGHRRFAPELLTAARRILLAHS
ncbi:hypothetical protein [Nocardia sp. NPDC024068]|uniref:hypothetical protein n=1 Tax=Nocardia sp. NPDC024068 TaxID=3157197 RepID=UPI0033F87143